jgi:hypothetical protein
MEKGNIEKVTREIMAESGLEIENPGFDRKVLGKISLEYLRKKYRRQLAFYILILTGIEFVVFSGVWLMLMYFPGSDYIINTIKDSLPAFHNIGNFILEYDYLFISFILVGVLNMVSKISVKSTLNR